MLSCLIFLFAACADWGVVVGVGSLHRQQQQTTVWGWCRGGITEAKKRKGKVEAKVLTTPRWPLHSVAVCYLVLDACIIASTYGLPLFLSVCFLPVAAQYTTLPKLACVHHQSGFLSLLRPHTRYDWGNQCVFWFPLAVATPTHTRYDWGNQCVLCSTQT